MREKKPTKGEVLEQFSHLDGTTVIFCPFEWQMANENQIIILNQQLFFILFSSVEKFKINNE